MMSKKPATIWYCGTVMVKRGLRMAKRGNRSEPNTLPRLKPSFLLVITLPPFISLPVPTMVSTAPTGTVGQEGFFWFTQYFSHGSSLQYADADTAFA